MSQGNVMSKTAYLVV